MADPYTHTKLTDVKDSAAEFGLGDAMEARFAGGSVDAEQTGFSYHRIKPGRRQGFGHRHEQAEEVCVVVRGSGRVKLDDEVVELSQLDAVRISPTVMRCYEAGDDGLDFIVFGPRREGDFELVPGWWSD